MFWNMIGGLVVIALLASGLFGVITWKVNIWLIAAVVFVWLVSIYNSLVQGRNQAQEAWSDIEVQMKRRYDLIPNIIETVKGYVKHERETLEKVTAARVNAMGAHSVEEHGVAENVLSGTLKTLFAVSENYPDLKANTNFLELQRELADSENKIMAARRFYNTSVRDFNIAIESFPTNVLADLFRFSKMTFFELVESEAREPVKVNF